MTNKASSTASRPKGSWGLVLRLYKESLHRHLALLVLSFACMAAIAGMASAYTYLMGPLVDKVFIARDGSLLWLLGGSVVAIFVVRSAASYVQGVLLTALGQNIVLDTQKRLYARLIHQDVDLFQSRPAGRFVGVFTYDVNLLRVTICNFFLRVGKDCLTVASMIGLMFYTDWRMGLYSTMAAPLAIIPILYLSRKLRDVSRQTQEEIGGLTATLTQAFQGIRLIRAYGLEQTEEDRVRSQTASLAGLLTTTTRIEAAVLPVFDGLGGLAIAAMVIYGGAMVVGEAMSPGDFLVFVGAVYGAYQPMRSLARVNVDLQTGLAAAERVFALIDRPSTILASEAAPALPRISGSVQFENVHFAYEAEGDPTLKGASFTAPAGSVTALVGPTGAGKSTLLNLIQRFHDPDQGRVLVNGVDVRAASVASLRDCIAVVSQDVTLFDDTIANNIRHGRLEATDAEVEAAALAAGCQDLVSQTPLGLATRVGDNGLRLSEGQRQRISIARALLRDAPILLLDEATSAQDALSEHQLQATIRRLMPGRTTIIVAHHPASIRDADAIHVLENGRVAESGTHDSLMHEATLYAGFINRPNDAGDGAPGSDHPPKHDLTRA